MPPRDFYTGVDFERRVYEYFGGSTRVSDGALTERDPGIATSQVEEALNDALLEVYQRVARHAADNGGPSRITHVHDFTYPAGAEFVTLRRVGIPEGSYVMEPELPAPWFDLVSIWDRSTNARAEKQIPKRPYSDFYEHSGRRWAFEHDAIYLSDRWKERGPSRAYSLRLFWIPRPDFIDISNDQQREDIPLELHRPVALNAACRLLKIRRAEDAAPVEAQYREDMALALRSVGRSVRQAQYVTNTRGRRLTWR